MEPIQRISQDMRADLVAYLDGELEDSRTARIETALADNPVVRHEVEMLTRTWEMLESLPRETASPEFTAKTLQTIVLEEGGLAKEEIDWVGGTKTVGVYLGWMAGLLASAVIGFLATFRLMPRENEQLLEDLPVIKNMNIYKDVGDADYLDRLKRSGVLNTTEENGDEN